MVSGGSNNFFRLKGTGLIGSARIIFGLIIVTLFIDGYITLKKGINRMTGSTVSQIGFLLVILLFILYQQQGVIF